MGGSQPGSSGGELQILNGERAEGGLSIRATLVPHISWISEISIVTRPFCSSSFLIQRVARFPLCSHSWLRDYLSVAIHCFSLRCHWVWRGSELCICCSTSKQGRAIWDKMEESRTQLTCGSKGPSSCRCLHSRSLNGIVQRMPASLTMERILSRHQIRTENSQVCSICTICTMLCCPLHNLHNAVLSFAQQYAQWCAVLCTTICSRYWSPQKVSGHGLTPCNSRITQNWQHLGRTQNTVRFSETLFLNLNTTFKPNTKHRLIFRNAISEFEYKDQEPQKSSEQI